MTQAHKLNESNKSVEMADLQKDIENLKDAFAQTTEDLRAMVKEKSGNLKDKIVEKSDDLKTKVKEKSEDIQENIFDFVKQHPVKTIALSVVAGMVLAKILQK